jgi:hypothetical protein
MIFDQQGADTATLFTAIFTAVAAFAALGAVLLTYFEQRNRNFPVVSAGYLTTSGGAQAIEFVNGGQGLAVQLTYFGVDNGQSYGGTVGRGHLLSGERELVTPAVLSQARTAQFIWVCRDVSRKRIHVWTYDERYERFKHPGRVKPAELFHRFYAAGK